MEELQPYYIITAKMSERKDLRLSPDHFAALASGYGDAQTITTLQQSHYTDRLLGVLGVMNGVNRDYPDISPQWQQAWEVFAESAPTPQINQDIVLDPAFGAWIMDALRAIQETPNPALVQKIMRFGGFAAAAAMLHNTKDFSVETTTENNDTVIIPSVGHVALEHTASLATIERSGGTTVVTDGSTRLELPQELTSATNNWRPAQQLSTTADGLHLTLTINNSYPLRDIFDQPLHRPLNATELLAWQSMFDNAWQLLVEHHRHYAVALAAGLNTLVPLTSMGGRERAMIPKQAFGAIAFTQPRDSEQLAWFLVHKFANSKFLGLEKIESLHSHKNREALLDVEWRHTPIRADELLEYAYSHLSSVHFWQIQADLHPRFSAQRVNAVAEHQRWRNTVTRLIEEQQQINNLTPKGQQVFQAIQTNFEQWR